jgi:hypothetical protein
VCGVVDETLRGVVVVGQCIIMLIKRLVVSVSQPSIMAIRTIADIKTLIL